MTTGDFGGEVGSGIAVPGGRARGLSTWVRALPRPASLARAALAEALAQLDRVFLWTPVAFGLGAATYLGLSSDPPFWPAATATVVLAAGAVVVARRGWSRVLLAALVLSAVAAAGFSVAKLRSDHVAAPIVPAGLGVTEVQGYVVDIETPTQKGPRLLIAPTSIGHVDPYQLPLRVRIVMPPGAIATPGSAISVLTLLDPPPSPAAPGAYDFARDAWFEGEGGVGLARAAATPISLPPAPWRLRLAMSVNAFRWATAERLAADMDRAMGGQAGDAAGLAIAVTTSHQDWLRQPARDDLRRQRARARRHRRAVNRRLDQRGWRQQRWALPVEHVAERVGVRVPVRERREAGSCLDEPEDARVRVDVMRNVRGLGVR